jgi:hypothetical protein
MVKKLEPRGHLNREIPQHRPCVLQQDGPGFSKAKLA